MLTPEYMESCGESTIVGIYDILSRSVVECLAKRIAKTGRVTASSMHQITQVQEAGKLMDEITEEVARITGFSNAMVSPALEFKSEGFITGTGAKLFTVAGPVLAYGISASVVYGIILYLVELL